ncbi:MAG: Ig-like domain repeat protein [Thermoleophilia bacterium]|nr:Ig-like domain repeat protein [Thermoleophilia bacterium]
MVDGGNPSATISGTPTGPIAGNGNVFTGTATDPETSIDHVDVTYSGPASGTMCSGLAVIAGNWTCTFDTNPGPALPDGLYTLTVEAFDAAGNSSGPVTRTVVVDNNGPVLNSLTLVEASGGQYIHVSGTTAYFNPAGAGTIRVDVDATDAGAGMDRVDYPSFVFAPWSGGGPDSVVPYEMPYTWISHGAGTASPGPKIATLVDLAGNTTPANFTVVEDAAAPTGASIDTTPAITNAASTSIAFTNGTDAASGVATRQLQRSQATYANGSCGVFGPFANVGPANPASPYVDATIADGYCYQYQLLVTDNVGNVATASDTDVVQVDRTKPTGSVSGTPAGPSSGTITFTGDGSDLVSQVAKVDVRYKGGPSPDGDVCLAPTLTPPAYTNNGTWSCNWDTVALSLLDGTYTIELIVTDRAGNASNPITRTILIDNNPPTVTFNSFSEGTNPQYQYWAGGSSDPMYYNSNFGGSFDVLIDNVDGGTGADRVDWVDPDLAAPGWVLTNGTDSTGTPFSDTFTWVAGAAQPGAQLATGYDIAGTSATAGFTILDDTQLPTGGTISYPTRFTNAGSATITYNQGSDALSGIGGREIWREQSPLSGGTCTGPWSGYTLLTSTPGGSPYADSTTQNGFCYHYQLRVLDNVGNVATYNTTPGVNEEKVDRSPPTGSISGTPVGPSSGTIPLSGTSADGGSGVVDVDVTYSGPASGVVCNNQPANWSCNWDTVSPSLLPEGTYTITSTITDAAGNVATATRTITIDNTPPSITFDSFAEGSNPQYQFAIADTMYYNPAFSGDFTVRMSATDLGSGMNRVEFLNTGSGIGAGWTPAGLQSDTTPTGTLYDGTFAWGAASIDPGTLQARAFDVAGTFADGGFTISQDTSTPSGGSVSSPITIQTSPSITVTFNPGGDTGSGIGGAQIQRRDGTYTNGICNPAGGWSNIGLPQTAAGTYVDNTVLDGHCYEYQLVVNDNVANSMTVPPTAVTPVDLSDPTGGIDGTPADPFSATVTITGTASDAASGVQNVEVRYKGGPSPDGDICVPGAVAGGTWSCPWNTSSLLDGTYDIELIVRDNAGRTSTAIIRSVVVDNQAPVITFKAHVPSSGANYQYWSGLPSKKVFVNTAQTGTVQVQFTATDLGTGVQDVTFPGLGANWSPGGADAIATAPDQYDWNYTWTATAANPGTQTAIASDNAGNTATDTFIVEEDITAPTGGGLTVPNITSNNATPSITFTASTDGAGSGIGTRLLQRRDGVFSGGSCSPAGGWTTVATNPTSPYTPAPLTSGRCYEWQLLVSDNVGNVQTIASPSVYKLDTGLPTGAIDPAPADPFSGSVTITGTASDGLSGVSSVDVTWTGPGATSGNICLGPALSAPPDPRTWSCPWATPGVDGSYTITLVVTDLAGNVSAPITRIVTVDNQAPTLTFDTIVETGGNQYQFSDLPNRKHYYNPNQTGNFEVRFIASDAGTGISSVDFPTLAAPWSGGGSDNTVTPVDRYEGAYTFSAVTLPSPGVQTVTAYDNAGNSAIGDFELEADSTAPGGGSLTVPNTTTNSTSVTIGTTPSNDTQSGVATLQLQRRQGTFNNGACGAMGGWANVGPANPGNSYVDTAPGGFCYEYQRVVTDNVGNVQTAASVNQVKVDDQAPTGTFDPTPTGPISGTTTITGTASDGNAGVASIALTYSGPASGTMCTATLAPPPDPRAWTCSWDTSLLADGTYQMELVVTDLAGNSSAMITKPMLVDNQPPVVSFLDYVEVSGLGYQHWKNTGPADHKLYVNPAQSGRTTVRFTASDAGTGMDRIDYPDITGGWTPAGGSVTGIGPNFAFDYDFTGPGITGAGLQTVSAFDQAGNSATATFEVELDSTAPAGGSITPPSIPATNAASVNIPYALAADAQSGLGTAVIERQSSPYAAGTCTGPWSGFAPIATVTAVPSPYSDAALSNTTCYEYQIRFTDNVGNTITQTNTNRIRIDRTLPSGTFDATPASPFGGVETITGTATDNESGVANVDVTYTGAATGNVCLGASPVNPWSCVWDTTTVVDGNYTLHLTVTDFAGNVFTTTKDITVDNAPPVASFASFTEVVGGQFMFAPTTPAPGSTMYVNPAQGGEFTVTINATDAGVGMQDVTFPDLASAGWTPPGGTDASTPYSLNYVWTGPGAAEPGTVNATATDLAGNFTNVPFRIENDSTAPTGGTITPLNVTTNAATHDIAFTKGSDSQSGIGTVLLQRDVTTFSGGTCGIFPGTWTTIATDPTSPFSDATTVHGNCYKYQLIVNDNVSNPATYSNANTFRVDRVDPIGDIDPSITGPLSGVENIFGTSSDATSGVSKVDVRYTGPSSGDICLGPATPTAWSCNWDTTSLADGTYTIELTVTDNAGNTFVITRPNLIVDNQPPVTTFVGFIEGTNGPWQHAIGTTMYYNNNVGYSGDFKVEVNATDAGTGVANVTFPAFGAGWTPAAPAADNSAPYQGNYAWTAGSANPSLQTATATDVAGNSATVNFTVTPDNNAPTGATISYADGVTNATSMVVNFNKGNDGLSGIRDWVIERSVQPYAAGSCPAPTTWVPQVTSPAGSSWTDPAIPDASCVDYRLVVTDNVSNSVTATTTDEVEVDRTAPTGLIDALPPSPFSGTVSLTGTSSDGESGIAYVELRALGAPSPFDEICLSPPSPTAWTCSWNTTTVSDGPYDLELTVYDKAGNSFTYVRSIVVDNQPPTVGTPKWVPQTNPQWQYVNAAATDVLWFNSNQSGSAKLMLRACDSSNVEAVNFPALGAGWVGGPAQDITAAPFLPGCTPDLGGDFENTHTWSAGAVDTGGPLNLTACQGSGAPYCDGATTTAAFRTKADGTGPVSTAIDYGSITTNVNDSGALTLTVGNDGLGSGIRGWRLERQESTLLADACSAPGPWTVIANAAGSSAPTYNDTAMVDGHCYQYRLIAIDNVGNETTATDPDIVKYDATVPNGTIDAAPAGPVGGAAVVITGTSDDLFTAVDHVELSWTGPQAPGSGAMCADPNPWTPTWSCTWDTTGFVDGTYTMILTVYDLAGNVGNASRTIVVDNQPPISLFDSWTETINPQYQYVSSSTLYFNPNQTGSAELRIAASDAGTGIANVAFPDLDGAASLWTPGAGNGTPPNPYLYTYSWNAGAASSGPVVATAFDNAGNSSTVGFQVISDGTGPTGQTINPINSYVTTLSTNVPFTTGSDALSGVGSWQLQRQEATLTGGICGAYGGWADIGPAKPASPYADGSLANGKCYQYRLQVTDNVGNTTPAVSLNEVKVDNTRPTGTIVAPAGPWAGAQTVDATTADTGSGVASALLTYSGPASGTICNVTNPGATFSCPWDSTSPAIPDGTYTVTLLVTDRAGNTNDPVIQETFVIDNNGPTFAFDHYVEGANPQYQFIAGGGSIMYVNPNGNGNFDVFFTGTDAGAGMDRVDFPDVGTNWSPSGGGSDTVGPEPNWKFTYSFSAGNAEPSNPTDPIATAWDLAGNSSTDTFTILHDAAPPTGGSIDVPTLGPTNAASVDIDWTNGTDALSGVGDVIIQRRNKTYAGGSCTGAWSGWTQVATGTGASGTWTDSSLADGKCYEYGLLLNDNVANQSATQILDALGDVVRIDRTPPTGTIDGPAGPWAGTVSITGTASDGNSGVVDMDLTTTAPTANNICLNMPLGSPWTCVFDTTTLPEGTYTFNLALTDAAGNVNSVAITYTVLIDNGGPLVSNPLWTEQVNPQFMHVDGLDATKLYYNPTQTGTARFQIDATDGGAGMQDVVFPALGTGWTAAPGLTSTGPTPYFVDYTFNSATAPGAVVATARDLAGNTTPQGFSAVADGTQPSGGSIDYTDGYTNVTSASITFNTGTDGVGPNDSGIGAWQIVRESAALSAGTCGVYGGPLVVGGPNPGGSSYSNPGLADGTCYRYSLVVTDNVGNAKTYTVPKEVKVDTTVPVGTIDALPASPVSAIQTFTGTSGDTGSGVQTLTVTYTGPSPVPPCTVTLPTSVNPWSCNINTALYGDGTYTLSLVVTDKAGNTSVPVTRDVVFDNNPPVIDPMTWTELTGNQYTHPAGDDLWFNPVGSATASLSVPVTDPGSGVASVTFPAPGAGWTPGAPVVNTTPPSPYSQTFGFTTGASDPATMTITATDIAGNSSTRSFELRQDTTAPTGSTISYLGGPSSAPSTSITIDTSLRSDGAGSGLGRYQLQRQTGALAAGVCTMSGTWVNIGAPNEPSPFVDTTTVDGNCYEYRLLDYDNVENFATIQPGIQVQVDRTAPTADITDPLAGDYLSGTYTFTGNHGDTGSGVAYFDVTFVGSGTGNICAVNDTQASPWSCAWDTTAEAEGPYDVTIVAVDNAGNASVPFTISITVDNSPPSISFDSWVEGTNPQFMHPVGNKMWFNPTGTGSFGLKMAANDSGAGMDRVDFPALGAGWNPVGGQSDNVAPSPYQTPTNYSWTAGASDPASQVATAFDLVGNSATAAFEVDADTVAPTGVTISPQTTPSGYHTSTSEGITFNQGVDTGGSGVGRWQLQRQSSPLSGGVCTGYGSWGNVGPVSPAGPTYTDNALVDGNCYRYQIKVWDNVENVTTLGDPYEVKVDATKPTGTIDALPPYVSGVVNLSGTHADTYSGVASFSVDYANTATGNVCSTVVAASPWSTPSCDWDTLGLALPDGPYDLTITVIDNAGNISDPFTVSTIVDNGPPTLVFNSFVEGAGAQYQHAVGTTMYFNPAQAGGFTLNLDANDAGSGVQRVDFPALGANWSPASVTADTSGPNPYAMSYNWSSGAGSLAGAIATAFDNVGNTATTTFDVEADNTAPTGSSVAVTIPASGYTNLDTVDVTFELGADAQAGIGGWQLQRQAGTLAAGACTMSGTWSNIGPANVGGPTPPVGPFTYSDTPLADGTCYEYRIQVTDNVGNVETEADTNQLKVDKTAPFGAFTAPVGPYVSSTISLDGTHGDAFSGVDEFTVTYSGSASGTVCANETQASPWSCTFDTTTVADGTYTFELVVTDLAGNVSAPFPYTLTVDNSPPTINFLGWIENGGANFTHPVADTMFYNPTGTGTFTLQVTADDTGSGVKHVMFPQLGANWTPAAPYNDTTGTGPAPSVYDVMYGFNNTSATPTDPLFATAEDKVMPSHTATTQFHVVPDPDVPVGGSVDYLSTTSNATDFDIDFTQPNDGSGSGIKTVQLQRESALFDNGDNTCDAFDNVWVNIGPANPTVGVPVTDSTTMDGHCYRYRLLVNDNVGNQTSFTTTEEIRVDRTAPTGTFDTFTMAPPVNTIPATPGAFLGGIVTIDGSAADGASGLTTVGLEADDGVNPPFTIGDPTTTGPNPWQEDWDTSGSPDGTYTITAHVRDLAGNTGDITINVVVDNTAPVASLLDLVEVTNGQYQFADLPGSTVWYNPAQSGSFRVLVQATDTPGSGMQQVDFPALGAGWTPAAPFTDNVVNATPPDSWGGTTYDWTAGPTTPTNPLNATAIDKAGNTTNVPFNVKPDAAAPTAGTATTLDVYKNTQDLTIGYAPGVDNVGGASVNSGFDKAQLMRQVASFTSPDTCGVFGLPSPAGPVVTTPVAGSFVDATPTSPHCYQYFLRTYDKVGNYSDSPATSVIKFDNVAPLGAIDVTPGPFVSGPAPVMTGTASDVDTGVRRIDLTYDDGAGHSGSICGVVAPPGSVSPTWSCTWNTTAGSTPDGVYTLTLLVTDFAGNTFTAPTKTLTIDNTPPVIDDVTIVENVNPQFQHIDPSDDSHVFYNPNPGFNGSFQVKVLAHDDGTGMSRIEFPDIDGAATSGWTPDGDAVGSSQPGFSFVQPLASPEYTANYAWTPGATSPGLLNAVAYDNAWAMIGDPTSNAPFTVTPDPDAPTGGFIQITDPIGGGWLTGPDIEISFSPGADALSGLRTWKLQRNTTTITAGACDPFGAAWVDIATVDPIGPILDSPPTDNTCVQYRLVQEDNVGNVDATLVTADIVKIDRTAPTGTIDTPVTVLPTTFVNGTISPDGTADDGQSGLDRIELRALGTPSPDICLAPNLTPTLPTNTATWGTTDPGDCDWDTLSGTADGPYTLELTVYDIAGNSSVITKDVFVDNTPPALTFKQFVPGTNPTYQFIDPNPSILWINAGPGKSGSFNVEMSADDGTGSGVNRVEFPDHGAGWMNTPASRIDTTATAPDVYDVKYTWSTGANEPGDTSTSALGGAIAYDNLLPTPNQSLPVPYTVLRDDTAPAGGSITYPNGWWTSPSVDVNFAPGSDTKDGTNPGSGIRNTVIERASAPLSGGTCGAWGAWGVLNGGVPVTTSPFNDATITDGKCYQYRIKVRDNVDNCSTVSTDTNATCIGAPLAPALVIKVDTTAPSGTIDPTPMGPFAGNVNAPPFSGTSSDSGSGVNSVTISVVNDGNPAIAISQLCQSVSGGPVASFPWTCSWDTISSPAPISGQMPDGTYTMTLTVKDNAGNTFTTTRTNIVVDNTPPIMTLHDLVEGTSPQYQYADLAAKTMWINSGQGGDFKVQFDVVDTPAGVRQVDYADPDAGATGWVINPASQLAPVTVGGSVYESNFTWSTGASEPNNQLATATDYAGNTNGTDGTFIIRDDTAAPTGTTISQPTGYVAPGSMAVTFATGTDQGSTGTAVGLDPASTTILRRSVPVVAPVGVTPPSCGVTWSGYTPVKTNPTGTTWSDATAVADPTSSGSPWGTCYQYQIQVSDRVGNTASYTTLNPTIVAEPDILVTRPVCPAVAEDGSVTCTLDIRLATGPSPSATIHLDGGSQLRFNGGNQTLDLTFTGADWWINQTVTVEAYDDAIMEMDPHPGQVVLTATSADPVYDGFPITPENFDVDDNDFAGVDVTALGAPANVTDVTEGGASDTVQVVLTSEPTAPVTITGVVGNGTAPTSSPDAKFAAPITFLPTNWNVPQTMTIDAIDDNFDELDPETNSLSYSISSSDPFYTPVTPNTGAGTTVVTVHDNDTAAFTYSSTGPFHVTEGGASQSFTIALQTIPTAPVTLDFTLTTGQATATPMTLTFTPGNWNVPQTVTVAAVDDAIDEMNGMTDQITTVVTSADPQYAGQFVPPFDIVVDDNDTAGIFTDSAPTEQATEGGQDASWKVRLTSEPSGPVQIDLSMLVGQATVTTPASGILVFTPANWDQFQDVVVQANDDPVAEGIHYDTLRYTVTSGDPLYDGFNLADVPIEITDNEFAGVALSKTKLFVDEGGRTDTYTVQLTSQPAGDVTIVVSGDADVLPSAVGNDQDTAAGTVTLRFTPLTWNIPVVITATAVDDRIAEGTPHMGVLTSTASSTSDPAYNTSGTNPITIPNVDVEITDNDQPGIEVQHTGGGTNVAEGGATDTYLVRLKSAPSNIVTVRPFPDDQVTVSPASVTFDSSNWDAWQTITVKAVDDPRVEGPHKGYIKHGTDSLDPFYVGVEGDTLEVDITDNDSAGVQATADDGSVTVKEGKPGTCDYVDVVLTAQPSAPVTVRIFPDDAPDVAVAPVNGLEFRPENWNIPQRYTICAVDDKFAEPTEIKNLKMRSFSEDRFYNGGNWPEVTVTIFDDDAAVITRHEPHDQRYLTVTRNDRLTAVFSVKLFDKPAAPVKVYIRYPKDLTGSVDGRKGSKTKRKYLTFTPKNWYRRQYVRVWYQRGSGGTGTITRTITFRVASKDRRYNGIRPRGIKVRIKDNNRVGNRFRTGTSSEPAAARKWPSELVAAPLPKAAPAPAIAQLPEQPLAAWDPRTLVGKRFDMPWATYDDGTTAKGGSIRIVGVADGSAQGFENIDYAAKVVRVARKNDWNEWTNDTRYVVVQGADRRYYVYSAHLASDPANTKLEDKFSIAVYVFGPTWASWRDDAGTWRAARDTAIS